MKYSDFEEIISSERMLRYLHACNGDTRKAMTLYRYNLKVSQEMFTIVSCFEVALRNRINAHLTKLFGMDWLRDSVLNNGIFNIQILQKTRNIIYFAYRKLERTNSYSHSKLVAEMEFGNICFLQFNIVNQEEIYYLYFPINLVHQLNINIIRRLYLMN